MESIKPRSSHTIEQPQKNDDFMKKRNSVEPILQWFAMKLCKDRNDAEELLQETCAKCLAGVDRFKPWTNFKAWSTTIMYNTFVNTYRIKQKRKVEPLDTSYHKAVKWDALNNFLAEDLAKAIASLKEDSRIPFVMHHEWYKYQEIADEMDLPIWTVKSRIFFARKELKELLYVHKLDRDY